MGLGGVVVVRVGMQVKVNSVVGGVWSDPMVVGVKELRVGAVVAAIVVGSLVADKLGIGGRPRMGHCWDRNSLPTHVSSRRHNSMGMWMMVEEVVAQWYHCYRLVTVVVVGVEGGNWLWYHDGVRSNRDGGGLVVVGVGLLVDVIMHCWMVMVGCTR